MMIPKQNPVNPEPLIAPNSAPVKPNSDPQFARMPPRIPKPTPAARMAANPAQSRRFALGTIPLLFPLVIVVVRSFVFDTATPGRASGNKPGLVFRDCSD